MPSPSPIRRDLIVIGASAGGIEVLKKVTAQLPADLPAAIAVVVHVPPSAKSLLPQILGRGSKLPVKHAAHGEPIEKGHIYLARPDHHLLVHENQLHLSRGPRIVNHRPAIDALFLSAARWHGARTIGVLLSGLLDDGTHGIFAIRTRGGTAVAQDPQEALFSAMPANAIEQVGVDHIASSDEMAQLLATLAGTEVLLDLQDQRQQRNAEEKDVMRRPSSSGETKPEGIIAAAQQQEQPADEENLHTRAGPDAEPGFQDVETDLVLDPELSAAISGPASGYTCPDCHGALWEMQSGSLVRYRCRVGHVYGAESLLDGMSEQIEAAIWAGYRALEEAASLAARLGDRARARGQPSIADRYQEKYLEALERAKVLRVALEAGALATNDESSSLTDDLTTSTNNNNTDDDHNDDDDERRSATEGQVIGGAPSAGSRGSG